MQAARYSGQRSVALQEVAEPEPGPGEVLVRVRACGICGSDLHAFRGSNPGRTTTPGHELAGEIVELGPEVSGWDRGTPVAIEPWDRCTRCAICQGDDYQLCSERALIGGGVDGGLAEYVKVPAYVLRPLPSELSGVEGALAEPMGVAVHGVRLARVAPGDRVLVQGSGVIGLFCTLAARAAGAEVTATARYPHQAEAAERLGARWVYPADEAGERELAERAAKEPFDVVLESVGGEADTLVRAPTLVRPGGTVCVLGLFFQPPRVGAMALVGKEIRMVGSAIYGRADGVYDFSRGIDLLSANRDLAASLITHRRPLDAVAEAFALADDKSSQALKVIVEP
ncbi:MAG: zinc-dependent alcohol dehydrogenase [Dehalococcoidia bacterium]